MTTSLKRFVESRDVTLSKSQNEAIDKMSNFLNSDSHCFVLKGYAGTGKTFIIALIKEYLDSINYQTLIYKNQILNLNYLMSSSLLHHLYNLILLQMSFLHILDDLMD